MKQIKYKGENTLSFAEYGDKKGYPILIQHGLIASIKDYHLFDRLIESKKRLICIARPGYGDSSPYHMANMAEWGKIVSVLVDKLALAQFDVMGLSSGAPYSYAIGYTLPAPHVRNIFIFSGTPALYDDRVLKHWPYPVVKDASIAEMAKVAREVFFPNITPKDLEREDIRDSLNNNCFGIAQDLRLRCMDWGFTLSEIKAAVYMEHSQADSQVPFASAEMTAKMIPECRLTVRDGAHFTEELLDRYIQDIVLSHA